jgi:hypothetical protein
MSVKGQVLIRQEGKCGCGCGQKLQHWKDTQFDHNPALALRPWSDKEEDTIPPANDPEYIMALRKECHARKTYGAGRAMRRGSDIHEFHRGRRLREAHQEHQLKMLKKTGLVGSSGDLTDEFEIEVPKKERKKWRWPKRPFPTSRAARLRREERGNR